MHSPLPRLAASTALALAGGLALWLAFPDHDLWWLAPVGVALVGGATWRAGFRRGAFVGLIAGWAFFVPTLSWSGIYVGALPWLALATLEALYVALMSGLVGWGSARLVPRWSGVPSGAACAGAASAGVASAGTSRRSASLPRTSSASAGVARRGIHAAYLLVPLGWVAQELARSTTPWGGFPWARLAFSQADSPLVHLAAFGGAPGVTFAVALVGTALLVLGHALARAFGRSSRPEVVGGVGRPDSMSGRGVLGWVATVTLVATAAFVFTPATDGRQVTVGFVQGNVPHPGLDFNAERRAVLDNHVRGTEALAARGLDGASLVVWPENSSDIDPFRNLDARAQIDRAVDAVGVPILLGAVLTEPPGHNSNVSLLYRPGEAEPERYTKLHPVPFAEYIPFRSFFARFTSAAELAGNFVAGTEIGAFRIDDPSGGYWALPTICFEVAYDGLMRDAVLNPRVRPGLEGSLLVVQTNNATFGYTAESEQQFAISRLRAIEHGRSVVHVSTVGVSGLVDPDGSVTAKTGLFTAEQAVVPATVRATTTWSDRLGAWPERGAVSVLLALLLVAALAPTRRVGRSPLTHDSTDNVVTPGAGRSRAADPIEDDIRA